jgi:minor extracellular protease Epr
LKKFLSAFLAGSLVISAVPFVGSAAPVEEQKVIVVFEDKVDKEAVADAEGEINRTFKNAPVASVTVPSDEINELKKDPSVERVEKDILVRASAQTLDWGIQATNTPTAWNAGYTGKGINIAVVDTGVAPHDDLVLAGGKSFVDYTTSYSDDNGHGTHVAGIIGAEDNNMGTKGVAPDANIYAVKALKKDGSGNLSSILAGIDWAITNKMDIVNLSLGVQTHSAIFKSMVDKAYANGVLVVAAAGNDGTAGGSEDSVDYPARYDSAIAVAAIDSANNRVDFSSTGNTVEIAAPGVSILATYLNNGYAKMSGTSMAAPYVAGQLALLKQANPTMTNAALRSELIKMSKDLGGKGRDPLYGYGLTQAPSGSSANPGNTSPTPAPVLSPVTGLAANMKSISGLPGEMKTLSITSTHKNGQKADRTKEAEWKSENVAIATVENGQVIIKQFGKTNIAASFGGKTVRVTVDAGVRSLTANAKKISGKPTNTTMVTLTAVLPDGRKLDVSNQALWNSDNINVATVENGLVTINQFGKTNIVASFGGKTAKVAVDTSIRSLSVNTKKVSGKPGDTAAVTLTATLSDGKKIDVSQEAEWKTENAGIATVTSGLVTINQFGKTKIVASFGGKTVKVAVDTSIRSLSANTKKVSGKPGDTAAVILTATLSDGKKIDVSQEAEWKTENAGIATVTSGLVTINQFGKTNIVASFGGKMVKVAVDTSIRSLSANTKKVSGKLGDTAAITLIATLSDGKKIDVSQEAEWKTENDGIATVTSGLVTINQFGKTNIVASFGGKTVKVFTDIRR